MERGVSAAGEGFPSHQFPSIVHQGGAIEVSGLFRSSSPPARPGATFQNMMQVRPCGRHDLPKALPQLKSCERALTLETSLHIRLAKSAKNPRRNANGFWSDRFRSSIRDPSQPVRSQWAMSA